MELKKAKLCEECNGIGEVSTMERVWANEPHMAPVGSAICANCIGSGEEIDEDIVLERILENLTKEQEKILQDKCFEELPMVLDDDMPDMFESWLENQSLEDLIKYLYAQ